MPATLSIADLTRIVAVADPVVRNLQITQCYYELSTAFSSRTGPIANWCTFATWASKQAGQTIRREDFRRSLEALLSADSQTEAILQTIAQAARQLGSSQSIEKIKKSVLVVLINTSIDRASNAVSRGNRKVFEEIGLEFARFIQICFPDEVFQQANLDQFNQTLRPGLPPDGQLFLRQAFSRYYQALFESDVNKRAELQLLANLEIGFHEQTRLQPEIAESLNMVLIDPEEFRSQLISVLFPDLKGFFARMKLLFNGFLGQPSPLEKAIDKLLGIAQQQVRSVITVHLMTLGFPNDLRLRLSQDVPATIPVSLTELKNQDLLALLTKIDPTLNSVRESGATDWANLPERLHFIADLFRCYQETSDLMSAPFSPDQVRVLRAGKVPSGRL
ncbi:hypothetical protein [Spirosoma sp. KNUC1025]|uniref:hypothetical protein n=1 Tax=Spirosoma sp. KNUC1025 TaxID=2894082 RepID=UPI003867C389|nr:hypothetical protein LN737_18430 [Spirosoma sp. KNUC1025]